MQVRQGPCLRGLLRLTRNTLAPCQGLQACLSSQTSSSTAVTTSSTSSTSTIIVIMIHPSCFVLACPLLSSHHHILIASSSNRTFSFYFPSSSGPLTTPPSSFAHFLHSRDRDLDQAHELFTRALEIDPDSAESHCYLGGLYLDDACKQYDKAEKHFQRCLQIDPQHVNALAFYGLLKQEVAFRIPSSSCFLLDHLSLSLPPHPQHGPYLDSMPASLPSPPRLPLPPPPKRLLQVTKDYNAAERMMSQALMLEPRHPEALSHFATFLGKVHQDYTNAEKMYDMVRCTR